jgi:hypothetical protein
MTVNLTGVTNAQETTITLSNVADALSQVMAPTALKLRALLGDVNGDGAVNSADATVTRNRSGQPADGTNFRADVNVDGTINSADATIVRANSGNGLPQANGAPEQKPAEPALTSGSPQPDE